MTAIAMPTIFINKYLYDKFIEPGIEYRMPFFPSSPTAIDDFTEQFPNGDQFYVYDRMMKMRRTPFPHIKNEQMLMYFYARGASPSDSIVSIYESSQKIQDWLDRGDESAQDVNEWIKSQLDVNGEMVVGTGNLQKKFKPVYFHSFKVFQLQETADIIDFGTARTWAGNKLIVEYTYHTPQDYNSTI